MYSTCQSTSIVFSGHQSNHHGPTFHLASSSSSVNKAVSGRRCSRRSRARPTALQGPTDGVATEERRLDVPRRRGVDGLMTGSMGRHNDGPSLADVAEKNNWENSLAYHARMIGSRCELLSHIAPLAATRSSDMRYLLEFTTYA